MSKQQTIKVLAALLAGLLAFSVLTGGALAALETETVEPASNETVEATVAFNGETSVTVDLVNSTGSTVQTQTLDSTGEDFSSGDVNLTASFDVATGGTYDVQFSATDATAVTATSTSVSYSETGLDVTASDSLLVDVAFTSASSANVTVSNSTYSDTKQVSVSSVSGDSVMETAEWTDLNGTYDVTVEYADSTAVNQSYITVESDDSVLSGVIGGASQTQMLGFGVLVVGIVYARNRDMI